MTDETYIPDLSSFQGRFTDALRTEGFSSTGALATRSRIPESTFRRWATGETKAPRKSTLALAAKVLRHRVEWLLKGEGDRYVEGAKPPTGRPADARPGDARPMTVEQCVAHVDQAIDSVEHALRTLRFVRSQLLKN